MQEELEKGSFTLNICGEEVLFDTVLTFYSTKNGKNYVVYADTRDVQDEDKLYASIYDPFNSQFRLYPVETKEEWDNINDVVSNYFKEVLVDE